jgi:LysM repeat protein
VTNAVQSPLPPLVITVSKGDTAAKIAQDLGVTVSDLAEANPGTNVSRLKVGQKLKVPRPEAK